MVSSVLGLLLLIVIVLVAFKVVAFAFGGVVGLILVALLIYLIFKDRNAAL